MRSSELITIADDLSEFANQIKTNIPKLINKAATMAADSAVKSIGSIETALDSIIAIQESLIGEESDS